VCRRTNLEARVPRGRVRQRRATRKRQETAVSSVKNTVRGPARGAPCVPRAPVSCSNSISGQSAGCLLNKSHCQRSASVGLSISRFRLIGTRTAPVLGCSAVGQNACGPAAHDPRPLPELIGLLTNLAHVPHVTGGRAIGERLRGILVLGLWTRPWTRGSTIRREWTCPRSLEPN
jgi:hypothetical protein